MARKPRHGVVMRAIETRTFVTVECLPMKSVFAPVSLAVVLSAGCASSVDAVPGLANGKFVALSCAGNKAFQLRASDDGTSVRVRAMHGSAELVSQGQGVFQGDGYLLRTQGEGGISLDYQGKSQGKDCKPAA